MNVIKTLRNYESTGLLFHGSPRKLDVIEPRRSSDLIRSGGFNNDTALFATPYAAIAVAFACINTNEISLSDRQNFGTKYGIYYIEGRAELRMPSYFRRYFDKFHGYVYIIDEKMDKCNWQVKLYGSYEPLDCVSVDIGLFERLGGRFVWTD